MDDLVNDKSVWYKEHANRVGQYRAVLRKVNSKGHGASGSWDSQTPVNVQYPSGHVVSFPDLQTAQTHSKSVWTQLQDIYKQDVAPVLKTAGREYDAAYDTLNTMPQQLYQAVTTPLSDEEKNTLGINGEP